MGHMYVNRSATWRRLGRWATVGAVVASGIAVGLPSASAYGTYNAFGQQAEHEHITRVLEQVGVEPQTLGLIAGQSGHLGGVGAPDNPLDSSEGLGPGYKHCDDGDWLDIPGYPHSQAAAQEELRKCFRYFESQLDLAVAAAGKLVGASGAVVAYEAKADYSTCRFPFADDGRDGSAKCVVLNRLGRSLHLAEDFWSHSNWADTADAGKPVSITNPPGLGRTDVPAVLRYPGGGSAAIPEGLISGCDDSVPLFGPARCKGRVGHAALAKDNGSISTFDCASASPTSKYPRGAVGGNFPASVCGAERQVIQTWNDFAAAVRATYGASRGDAILALVMRDEIPATEVAAAASDVPSIEMSASAAPTSLATTSPAATSSETTAALVEDEAAMPSSQPTTDRNAAADDSATAAARPSTADALLPWTYALMVVVFAAVALGAWTFARSHGRH